MLQNISNSTYLIKIPILLNLRCIQNLKKNHYCLIKPKYPLKIPENHNRPKITNTRKRYMQKKINIIIITQTSKCLEYTNHKIFHICLKTHQWSNVRKEQMHKNFNNNLKLRSV